MTILIDLLLQTILQRVETSGLMVKWVIELSEFDLSYHPRSAMKVQVLADFLIECTIPDEVPPLELFEEADPSP